MSESTGVVAITTVLSILVMVDIVGNSLVCLIIKRNRDMRYAENEITIVFFRRIVLKIYRSMSVLILLNVPHDCVSLQASGIL